MALHGLVQLEEGWARLSLTFTRILHWELLAPGKLHGHVSPCLFIPSFSTHWWISCFCSQGAFPPSTSMRSAADFLFNLLWLLLKTCFCHCLACRFLSLYLLLVWASLFELPLPLFSPCSQTSLSNRHRGGEISTAFDTLKVKTGFSCFKTKRHFFPFFLVGGRGGEKGVVIMMCREG